MERQLQHMELSGPARGATAATRGESTRSPYIQDGRLRRPYLTEEDFRGVGVNRGESTYNAGLSQSESRRRSGMRMRHAELGIPPEMTAEEVRARGGDEPREELDGWAPPMAVPEGLQRSASEWVDGEHTDQRTWEQEPLSTLDVPGAAHGPTQPDDSGWGDLEDALSTHIARRHTRHLEYMTQNAQLEAENQHLTRRREERISALVDGGQSFRLRHRASRERILAAMEGFMVERDRDRDRDRERQMSRVGDELAGRQSGQPQRSEHARRLTVANTSVNPTPTPKTKTQNTLTYLTRLRSISPEEAVALASSLDITPDLTSLSTLPKPVFSSILTPGATFTGTQIAGSKPSAVGRDRDYLRRMVASRNRLRGSVAGQGERQAGVTPLQVQGVSAARAVAERVMAREEGRAMDLGPPAEPGGDERSSGGRAAWDSTRPRPQPSRQVRERERAKPPRQWDVSVTIHGVDLDKGTVEGMMIAERVRPKPRGGGTEQTPEDEAAEKKKESSMRSFFDGEIIDIREVTLESESYKKEAVRVDLGVDARYWRGVGPFREALKEEEGEGEQDGGKDDEGEKEREADERLAHLLGNEAWMQKMMTEWILMRWRERCVLPSVATVSPLASSSTTTTNTTNPPESTSSTNTWNLTIGGFYYIALKRDTGKIDGLYYDPQSEPLQRLDLGCGGGAGGGGIRRWFPSVGFE
jgi:hypothetical protein